MLIRFKRGFTLFLIITLFLLSFPLSCLQVTALTHPYLEEDVYYCIRNGTHATYLTTPTASSGANAFLTTYTGDFDQLFTVQYNSFDNTYKFIPYGIAQSEMYALECTSVAAGRNVQVDSRMVVTEQDWTLVPYSSTSTSQFSIRPANNTALALTGNSGNGAASGTASTSAGNVYINTFGSTNLNQYWYIVKYSSLLQGSVLTDAEAQGRERVGTSLAYSLPVRYSGIFYFETGQHNPTAATEMDTVLQLYDSGNSLLNSNDNWSSSSIYSWFSHTLSNSNRYILRISEGTATDATNPPVYLTVSRYGELAGDAQTYADLTRDYIKLDDATLVENGDDPDVLYDFYNCLGYAIDSGEWEQPPGTLMSTEGYFRLMGYQQIYTPTDGCIVAYGTETDVVHFARYDKGVVTAKLGQLELVLHSQIDAYYEDSLYGEPVAYFEKVN